MFVALLSAFAGLTSAVSIALYWKRHREDLRYLIADFPDQDISHDTVNRLLSLINPNEFQDLLKKLSAPWLQRAAQRLIHIDGQAVCASKNDHDDFGTYFFNAYTSTDQQLISHLLIDMKKNEISTAIDLLSSFQLGVGDIVTADALNTQVEMVNYLVEHRVGYCLAVKDNQPTLMSEILYLFTQCEDKILHYEDIDADHGRIETRHVDVIASRWVSKE